MNNRCLIMIAAIILCLSFGASAQEMPALDFDDCETLDNFVSKSENLTAETASEEERGNFGEDCSFIQRTSLSPEWMIYKINPEKQVKISAYFWGGEPISHFNFYISKDNEKFKRVKPRINVLPQVENKWITVEYTVKSISAEYTYLKIEFQNLSGNSWTPALSRAEASDVFENAEFFDVEDTKYEKAAKLLDALSLMKKNQNGAFEPDKSISRGELTAVMMKTLNIPLPETNEMYFKDVPPEHEYAQYINMALRYNYIDTAEYFEPDAPAEYYHGIKIACGVLGYKPYAEIRGGYPYGYELAAHGFNVNSGVDKNFTRGECAVLVYNMLGAPILRQVSFGDETLFDYDRNITILSEYFKISVYKGVMTDNGITALTGESNISSNKVLIEDSEFICRSEKLRDYLGRNIELYADEDYNTVFFYDNTKEIEFIDIYDIISTEKNSIKYEKNGKTKNLVLDSSSRIIYNGGFLGKSADINIKDIVLEDGSIEIIDGGKIVKIKNYDTVTVSAKTDAVHGVYDKFTGFYALDLETKPFAFYRESKLSSDTKVNEGEVIQIAKSSAFTEIVVSEEVIYGTVESIGDKEVSVDGDVYKTSGYWNRYSDVKVGDSGEFYLNAQGRLASLKVQSTQKYGYIAEIGYDGGIGAGRQLKMLTSGGIEILNTDAGLDGTVFEKNTLIRYRTDKTGAVKSADNAGGEFVKAYSGSSVYHLSLFASLYKVTETTQVFFIPENRNDETRYAYKNRSFFKPDKRYNIEIYTSNDNYEADAIVVHEKGSELTGLTNYVAPVVVDKVSKTVNDEGDLQYLLTVLNGGEKSSVPILTDGVEDITAFNGYIAKSFVPGDGKDEIKRGEVLQFSQNEKGEIDAVRFLFTEKRKNSGFFEWVSGEWGAAAADNFFGETAAFYGKVTEKFSDRIIAEARNNWKRAIFTAGACVYRYENGRVSEAELSEILPEDEIFCAVLSGNTKIIMIIE